MLSPHQRLLQNTFGRNVKKIRLQRGLSQIKLAVSVETDIRQIQRIEAGTMATSVVRAYQIAHCLEVRLDDLFEEG